MELPIASRHLHVSIFGAAARGSAPVVGRFRIFEVCGSISTDSINCASCADANWVRMRPRTVRIAVSSPSSARASSRKRLHGSVWQTVDHSQLRIYPLLRKPRRSERKSRPATDWSIGRPVKGRETQSLSWNQTRGHQQNGRTKTVGTVTSMLNSVLVGFRTFQTPSSCASCRLRKRRGAGSGFLAVDSMHIRRRTQRAGVKCSRLIFQPSQ